MNIFTCPVCGEKLGLDNAPLLHFEGNSARCPKNHSFDIAAKGYLNLLLSQHKNVKDPGDSKEMVAARRDLLGSGAYQPLLDKLCEVAKELCGDIPAPVIADCGCGECWYTAGIHDALRENGCTPAVFGVDISKNALAAAKPRLRDRNISTAVASVFRLPIKSGCADMATVIFAPFMTEELRRIVKDGGYIITAIPTERHLYGLKAVLYDEVRLNEVKPYEIEGLEYLGAQDVDFTLELTSQDMLNDLFMMTPYYYKTSPRDSNRIYSYFGTNEHFSTECAFRILKYKVRK